MKVLILNGPNINFLDIREPQIYGNNSYKDLVTTVKKYAKLKIYFISLVEDINNNNN